MSDKLYGDNDKHLPHELSESRNPEKIRAFDYGTRPDTETGRFSIINVSSANINGVKSLGTKVAETNKAKAGTKAKIEEFRNQKKTGGKATPGSLGAKKSTALMSGAGKKAAASKTAAATGGKVALSSKNYRAEYMRRKKEREDAALGKGLTAKQVQEKILAEKRKEQEETFLRVRARELMEQIHAWRQKFGMGEYEASHIRGMIAALQQELNGIDARYWP